MKTNLKLFAIVPSLACLFVFFFPQKSMAQVVSAKVDRAVIEEAMAVLTGRKPFVDKSGQSRTILNRYDDDQRALAREYLVQIYTSFGFSAEARPARGTKATNVYATNDSVAGPTLFLGAHLDNVGSPGANDNASGIATELAIAIAYKKANPGLKITVAAFDLEERGLIGSGADIGYLKTLNIQSAINMDMVGRNYLQPKKLMVSHCNKPGSKALYTILEAAAKQLTSPLEPYEYCFGRSNHESLWAAGLPTLHLQGGIPYDDPCYHKTCDTIENVDFSYMENLGNVTLEFLIKLGTPAGTPPSVPLEPWERSGKCFFKFEAVYLVPID